MTQSQHTDDGYTYHTEPHAQGGQRYVRCTECGRESVPADPSRILHSETCSRNTHQ